VEVASATLLHGRNRSAWWDNRLMCNATKLIAEWQRWASQRHKIMSAMMAALLSAEIHRRYSAN
jgi:hypothetical protein